MRKLLHSCRQTVGKLWQVRAQSAILSPRLITHSTTLWVTIDLYPQLLRRLNTTLSTSISNISSLLRLHFYSLSTPPTKTTTSFLNFKSLVIVKELA